MGAEQTETHAADRKKMKKKMKKKKTRGKPVSNAEATGAQAAIDVTVATVTSVREEASEVGIEYVSGKDPNFNDPAYSEFAKVFAAFTPAEELIPTKPKDDKVAEKAAPAGKPGKAVVEEEDDEEAEISRKQRKKMKRLSIAELKQLVRKPEVVEQWDVTASDPRLLVHLKAYRNTVPVPKHWSQKRKYLQGKRGLEKPPFQLPDFIAATGIEKIRAAVQEKEDAKKQRAKSRDKMAPKMGKIDIDYQVLHDAFFKYQTKPKLTKHGDVYYEGKEFEVKLKEKKPGQISEDLKKALGMTEGGPPPWLINMQRYGPPPSYPNLKVPGLNAPIPEGAQYGYHPGGWGKPPVDEFGRPLYGDVFGTARAAAQDEEAEKQEEAEKEASTEYWGGMEEEEEESSSEEEEEEEEGDEQSMTEDDETEAGISSISSVPSGMDTPESLQLRKALRTPTGSVSGQDTPDSIDYTGRTAKDNKQLYQVLEQKEASVGNAAFGSAHVYAIPGKDKPKKLAGVDVNLTPTELENLDEATLKAKYDEQLQAEKAATEKEDVSDLMEEHAKKKRKQINDPKSKQYKNFKF